MREAKLTVGPVLFNWRPEVWRDFYFRLADEAPVDTVHLGEVVCSKRQPFFAPHLPEVMDRLTAAGKEVVLSSLALVMSERERDAMRALALDAGDLLVEANDLAIAADLAGRPHMIGPFVNVYNEGTLGYLAGRGARRICLPAELPLETLTILAAEDKAEIEVQSFGRLPLALSARCYHARSHNLHKDGCQYVCGQDLDGMAVDTMDGLAFLTVNGTQTMSSRYANLLGELGDLRKAGIHRFRLWPQSGDMVAVAGLFRRVLDGALDAKEAAGRLADLVPPDVEFANGYVHGREGHAFVA
ncbi:ubiquinone anaerobic biosynthesis protein UbiV [Telmatospirillum siberiense]|uniref:Ubiquinone biosynthesis protein UbiV n=1 Tax=Telmatospirillum siberiense TaxID=382514 RepID=A0A2N3Q1H5_9PROT|nr:U32 family peptidase [Telmatospirillum siberiense]PKU26509.1 U32 family peptidase [Telmatospirillum siberiense]